MRLRIPLTIAIAIIATVVAIHAQITSNPLPAAVEKKGLAVEIRDLTRLPDTRSMLAAGQDVNPAGWARVQPTLQE